MRGLPQRVSKARRSAEQNLVVNRSRKPRTYVHGAFERAEVSVSASFGCQARDNPFDVGPELKQFLSSLHI